MEFDALKGLTLAGIRRSVEAIIFTTDTGRSFRLSHSQDCCESVTVEDIIGSLDDLLGAPLVMAEEATSHVRPVDLQPPEYEPESQTWTFYRLATRKGYVTIRWFGVSNGYYSESVEFEEATPPVGED